mgnify:FL=1
MYNIGYIDDNPSLYTTYEKKLKRRDRDVELILIEGCKTKAEFVEKIYEKQIEVLLIDYKMASTFGFNGTTLISYINDQIRDLECFILTAVDNEQISDGLVASRNIYAKTVFDTEGDDPEKVSALMEFIKTLKESAEVFKNLREQKIDEYKALLKKRNEGNLGAEEEEFLHLYKVLSSYGMVEKLPDTLLNLEFEQKLNDLLKIGNKILDEHKEK